MGWLFWFGQIHVTIHCNLANRSNLGSAGKTLEAAIEATAFNTEWVRTNAGVIARWLKDHLKSYMTARLYRQ